MSLPPTGSIFLDGVQFTFDPTTYRPLDWPKRFSVHPIISNPGDPVRTVIQEFGVTQGDLPLKLTGQNPLSDDVVRAFLTRYRAPTPNGGYVVTDWLDDQFNVFIERFFPVPLKTGRDAEGALLTLYTYELDLRVLTITKLLGQAYTEAA
jgi:hypothetical protein